MALTFVLEVDELVFDCLVPGAVKETPEHIGPLKRTVYASSTSMMKYASRLWELMGPPWNQQIAIIDSTGRYTAAANGNSIDNWDEMMSPPILGDVIEFDDLDVQNLKSEIEGHFV